MAEAVVQPAEVTITDEEELFLASQWQLMWWRFRKHKVAMAGAVVVAAFYIIALGAEFLSSADPAESNVEVALAPPQLIHFFKDGGFHPYVFALKGSRDPVTLKKVYEIDKENKLPIRFFARGYEYKFLGFIPTDRHLFVVDNNDK